MICINLHCVKFAVKVRSFTDIHMHQRVNINIFQYYTTLYYSHVTITNALAMMSSPSETQSASENRKYRRQFKKIKFHIARQIG